VKLRAGGRLGAASLRYKWATVIGQARAERAAADGAEEHAMDDTTRTELEAAAFRRLVSHLRDRSEVQNIDLMNLAGFCRNCLSNWLKDAADARGVPLTKEESREHVYGMPYEEWKARHQSEARPDQVAAFQAAKPH
jgi:hypothetical protein